MAATRILASAAVGSLLVAGVTTVASAQSAARPFAFPVSRQASSAPGAIAGTVLDERGRPVPSVVVSVLGAVTTVAVTDERGRFELGQLAPGPYLIRAHISGYTAPRVQMVQVRASDRTTTNISLRRDGAPAVLAAGIGVAGLVAQDEPTPRTQDPEASGATRRAESHDDGETAWRVRHGRRSVLKDATIPDTLIDDGGAISAGMLAPSDGVYGASARISSAGLLDAAFTGQVNILTAGSFDTPRQLFSASGFSRNVANVRLSAPAGANADWSVAGALTQADVSSWVVAGSYAQRAPRRHRYDVGLSYSTQRYSGGNPLALRDLTDGSRNAGTIYAYDSFAVSPSATLSFGSEFGRYDYLSDRMILSPRVELTLTPEPNARFTASVAQRSLAPGAEEFLAPTDAGIWLPPQRTFSSLDPRGVFRAERGLTARVKLERDFGPATVGIGAFQQHVDDQLVTVFGGDLPGRPSAKVGHYLVGNTGDVDVRGYTAELRALVASRIHGAVEYAYANGRIMQAGNEYLMLLAPLGAGMTPRTLHDVTARIDTEIPETATRVLVICRVSNSFATPASPTREAAGPAIGSRFDVQVRQSLPFMNFSNARWEMLFAVRNFFRDASGDQSLYDELLVVRPPKRVVGGVTLHF